jgi:aryl-alcohol dehydrogenase-like predicted oxidoreductase
MTAVMDHRRLGDTGLRVSRLCLGMMSFGADPNRAWKLGEAESEPIVRRAAEGGVTFFDTADMYGGGASEIATGRLLRKLFERDEIVVATRTRRSRRRWRRCTTSCGPARRATSARARCARGSSPRPSTSRRCTAGRAGELYGERHYAVADRVAELAWLLQRPDVTAPVIGATKPGHVEDALAALELELTAEEVAQLEGTPSTSEASESAT